MEDEQSLHNLDNLAATLGGDIAYDVVDVIGVVAGVKPAAFIGGNGVTVGSDLLDQLGLAYTTSKLEGIVYVSQGKEVAERLAALHEIVWGKNARFPDENREIGKLLGYPATATEYFLKRLQARAISEQLPIIVVKRTLHTVSENFHSFILSPESYEEELKQYAEPLEEAVRSLAPKTYKLLERTAARERRKAFLKRIIGKDEIRSDTSIQLV